MNTISQAEKTKLASIKAKTLAGQFVPSADKQWVLDLARKMQAKIPAIVVKNAAKEGYNVLGLVVKG